jgi:hypothetical protein
MLLLVVLGSSIILPAQAFSDETAPSPGSDYPHIDDGEVRLGEHDEAGPGGCVDLGEAGNFKVARHAWEYTNYIYEETDISEERGRFDIYLELMAHIPAQAGGAVSDHSHFDDIACMYQDEPGINSDILG